MRKIAIVGTNRGSVDLVNGLGPDYEVWGVAGAWKHTDRITRQFEVHDMVKVKARYKDDFPDYIKMLNGLGKEAFIRHPDSRVPRARMFPLDDFLSVWATLAPERYFSSTIAYALGWAIIEGREYRPDDYPPVDEIKLFGVHMSALDEYDHQKPNAEYLIGYARGRGIKVDVGDDSPLLKGTLYEYDDHAQFADMLRDRRKEIEKDLMVFQTALTEGKNKISELNWLVARLNNDPSAEDRIGQFVRAREGDHFLPSKAVDVNGVSPSGVKV